jgi:hypothetical protein
VGFAGHDHREGAGCRVEPQVGLAVARVGAVAGKALIRQNGPDVAVELDSACRDGEENRDKQSETEGDPLGGEQHAEGPAEGVSPVLRHSVHAGHGRRFSLSCYPEPSVVSTTWSEKPLMQEIAPFVLLHVESGEVRCALWRLQQGDSALALFLSAETAAAYRTAAGLEDWQVLQPDRNGLLELLDAHARAGIRLAVLDPDLRQGRRLFDLQAIICAARQEPTTACE